ncbi:MAG TPA: NB-ARC domain-containing protein, partial [Pyrinomonadaceae bacterium]|nr:NB-ARC domain-containing protein [Pyrinomonadaceae bacterium]
MAPPRLAEFVQRPAEFDELLRLLLAQYRENPVAIAAALRGAGGYGKTTLAIAICHDQQILNTFKHGILWVTLGESASQQTLINEITFLSRQLSGERESFTGLNEATNRLIELLGDRDLLLVIDDVWSLDHARPFLQGGPRCARLITTRNLNTLPTNAKAVKVDAMKRNEAEALLGAGFEKYTDLPTVRNEVNALAERLGEWPLLLKLANGALRNRIANGDSFGDALEFIKDDLEENGLTTFDSEIEEERNRAVSATLGVSFKLLKESDLARFNELAVFPEEVEIPFATVEKFWSATSGLSRVNSQKLCERLYSLSLLLNFSLKEKIIRLHDVIRKYMIEQGRDRLPSIHNQLLESHCPVSTSSDPPVTPWSELPDDEPYLWDHLAVHMIEAGRGKELVATVKDWRYLAKKIFLRKSRAVEDDLIEAEKIAPNDGPLRTLRRGISVSSHLINHCDNRRDIESTMLVRLRHLTDLTAMLEDLAQNLDRPYVMVQTGLPDLPHPGLIRTLEGHLSYVLGCAFSPDGRFIVSASRDRTLKVWNALTGETLRTLEGHLGYVTGCAFSPDGRFIVSTSRDRTLKVWDALTGETLHTLEGGSRCMYMNVCAFSPDGRLIVSASW